jgi:hypothetical protein
VKCEMATAKKKKYRLKNGKTNRLWKKCSTTTYQASRYLKKENLENCAS